MSKRRFYFVAEGSMLLALHEPKQPPAIKFRRVSRAYLALELLLAPCAANRIPRDGEHAEYRREYASRHREYALRVPPVILQVRPRR